MGFDLFCGLGFLAIQECTRGCHTPHTTRVFETTICFPTCSQNRSVRTAHRTVLRTGETFQGSSSHDFDTIPPHPCTTHTPYPHQAFSSPTCWEYPQDVQTSAHCVLLCSPQPSQHQLQPILQTYTLSSDSGPHAHGGGGAFGTLVYHIGVFNFFVVN